MDAPTPLPFSGPALPLRPEDIYAVADELAVERAVIEAVLTVETGGAGGFLTDGSGRPRILFEAHLFGRFTDGRWDAAAPDLSRRKWTKGLYLGGAAEYGRLGRAVALDREAALRATSWGLFQILGDNHRSAGYRDVESYVADMAKGEGWHLSAFARFVQAEDMVPALQQRRWADFARRYNGPAFEENRYAQKLEAAYQRAAGRAPAPAEGVMSPLLRVGDRGPRVQEVQRILRAREAHLGVDGIFGRATEAALVRFQERAGLTADGIVGPRTWGALRAAPPAS